MDMKRLEGDEDEIGTREEKRKSKKEKGKEKKVGRQ